MIILIAHDRLWLQEQTIDGWLIGVEVKSVNHRYLEYTTDLKGYGFLENKLKSLQYKLQEAK
ncbi:MAG: hypothetical protein ACLR13_00905 [Acutalibacteraceae bacterium]